MMLHIQNFLRSNNTLQQLEEQYHIYAKRHSEFNNLVCLKYDQIESPFSEPIVQECRGIVLNEANDWAVVNRSMDKFFNLGQQHVATIDWNTARVQCKEDGSLIQVFPFDNIWHMATSGSFGTGNVGDHGFTFQDLFWRTFHELNYKLPPIDHYCFWFELTSPWNKIVVRHERAGLTLLGGRNLITQQELTLEEAHNFFPMIPKVKEFPFRSFDEITESFKTFSGTQQEGFVVVDGQFNRVKVKHDEYVRLHHLKDNLSSQRNLIDVVRNGEIEEVIATLPEYKDILIDAQSRLNTLVSELEHQYQELKSIPVQKDFAIKATAISRCPGALFNLRAKKSESIRHYLANIHIDRLVELLGYKG